MSRIFMIITPDGLINYWDDCVEIFIDEHRSKGDHIKSYNAFAYHIGLDYKVADYGVDEKPYYYNDHVETIRTKNRLFQTSTFNYNNLYFWIN